MALRVGTFNVENLFQRSRGLNSDDPGMQAVVLRDIERMNRLIARGAIQPILSACVPLREVGEAAYQVHHNRHEGKLGVLCLAPERGLGIDDPELRARVGEERIRLFERSG